MVFHVWVWFVVCLFDREVGDTNQIFSRSKDICGLCFGIYVFGFVVVVGLFFCVVGYWLLVIGCWLLFVVCCL